MQDNLVIVESPAKAKTIEKFLGKDYIVKSSFGHIRDLSKKDLGINIDDGFKPVYEIPGDKKKVVDELAKLAKTKTVWLASDEDREGEAIAWHLTEVLGLPVDRTKRIVFHEITKRAILEAIEKPRTVNMDLVNAQQARRILDRLVGFELARAVEKGAAGTVGGPCAVGRRAADRRTRARDHRLPFDSLFPRRGAVLPRRRCGQDALQGRACPRASRRPPRPKRSSAGSAGAEFTVSKAEEKPAQRYPAPPFTTSTLQQEAGRKLGMSVSQTMSVAQHLYEQGLITYMRTDSVNLSQQALAQCKEEITKLYGEKYSSWHNYKTKTKGAQEAHEAIRPSYIDRQTIEGTPAEKKLYDLIWKRTVASQMVCAELDRTTITIDISGSSTSSSPRARSSASTDSCASIPNPRTTTRPPRAARGCSPETHGRRPRDAGADHRDGALHAGSAPDTAKRRWSSRWRRSASAAPRPTPRRSRRSSTAAMSSARARRVRNAAIRR